MPIVTLVSRIHESAWTRIRTALYASTMMLRGRATCDGEVGAENRFRLILPMPKSAPRGLSMGAGTSRTGHDEYDEYDSYEAARRMREALQRIPEDTEGAEGEMSRGGSNDLYT